MSNTKKIALFGGTGFVGNHMRDLLLENGFTVKMLVRSGFNTSEDIKENGNLIYIEGCLASKIAITEVLKDTEACVVMTGPRSGSIEDMESIVEGTRMIVDIMQELDIKRFLKLSGVSVRLKNEPFPLPRRILDIGLGIAMKNQSKSKYLEQDIIEASDLDWTVIRPPVIKPGRTATPIRAHEYGFLGLFVKVENLCDFFIQQIYSDKWSKKAPTVG